MMISTKGRYALRILIDIAEHQADGYVPLKESADRQEISEKYLESIVNTLVKNGFVEGLRGKGGGYRLSRLPEQIVVYDVLTAMEGTLVPVACLEEDAKTCNRMSFCQTLPLWSGLNKVVTDYLSQYTVMDLMRRDTDAFDYVI
ncbi:MAG: Rrf2 family transcriptional regulator [Oscillospiraceae bacterium]|nr:Rrf2 family transcriptional regulator [Oscillospiraceae bacterium]